MKAPTSANLPYELAVRDVETLLKWANSASSWSSRLPAWIKAAKNRDRILHALGKLRELADSSGLR
ncbi:MAG: hypothetical protein LBQ92_04770 [Propionibacteriaceae bacterium]|jgi:hypothetical protein|nr:hypothetical protein [Propionibacteriaceae bacterium]